MRKTIALIVAFLIVIGGFFLVDGFDSPIENIPGAGTTYYVATTGDDDAAGAIATPWKTINYAANTVTAGDTVFVRGGTYTLAAQITPDNAGSSGNYITFQEYPGENACIDAGALSLGSYAGAFHITTDYIKVDGFTISDAHGAFENAGNAISAKGTSGDRLANIIIQNNYTYDVGGAGIQGLYVDGITIDNNELNDCTDQADQECISLITCSDFEIKNNHIYNIDYARIYWCGDAGPKEGIDAKVGCYDGSIHDNRVGGSRNGIYVDGFGSDSYDIDIYNNEVYGGFTDAGIKIGAEQAGLTEDLYNIAIYNNVIHDGSFNDSHGCFTQAGIIVTGDVGTYDNIDIYSNTIYNVSSDAIMIDGDRANPYYDDIDIHNNIFWSTDATRGASCYDEGAAEYDATEHSWSYNVLGTDGSNGGCDHYGSNNITKQPTWVNASSGCAATDLATTGTQTVNAGVDMTAFVAVHNTDYNDESRPVGGVYDIGAFEWDVAGVVSSGSFSLLGEVPWGNVGLVNNVTESTVGRFIGVEIR